VDHQAEKDDGFRIAIGHRIHERAEGRLVAAGAGGCPVEGVHRPHEQNDEAAQRDVAVSQGRRAGRVSQQPGHGDDVGVNAEPPDERAQRLGEPLEAQAEPVGE
jgi:hypothetical protein